MRSPTGLLPGTLVDVSNYKDSDHARVADGKYASMQTDGTDPAVLGEPEPQWGQAKGYDVGYRSVFGTVDHSEEIAPGIVQFSTPGHGGLKLSPARQRAMGGLSLHGGMYEEDSEAHLVRLRFPKEFTTDEHDAEDIERTERQCVADYFPDEFEAYTGKKLEFGQSSVRDTQSWNEQVADKPLVTSALGHGDGTVTISVRAPGGSNENDKQYRIPKEDYPSQTPAYGRCNNPRRVYEPKPSHRDVTPAPAPRFHRVPDLSGLSERKRALVEKDMSVRYAEDGGRPARNLAQIIEQDGLTGKQVYPGFDSDGSPVFSRKQPMLMSGSTVFRVSAATFDAFDAPDKTTDERLVRR